MKRKLFVLILLLCASLPLLAQVRISGTVSDNVGPMIGASVVEQGTTNGTVTGNDGSFALSVKPGATLVVSSIGYKDQEFAIGNQTRFTILMEEDTEVLEETVVIGYGIQRKSDVTGAIA
ncbi:MAG: carboxypeptidase-like regulatory domain-containing protein, partial [Bacteroidales bacterium]|nr:carboxypeptidase-like regulatory domain-containing protein [Bacteroidales bacterium]